MMLGLRERDLTPSTPILFSCKFKVVMVVFCANDLAPSSRMVQDVRVREVIVVLTER